MPTELILRKRASTRVGEIGLFCDVEVWEEEFSAIKNDSDVKAVVSQPRSLKQHKFAWALATKVAEACDFLESKDDAMNYMLIESRHARFIYDQRRDISYAVPKPTNWGAMDGTAFTKLLKRMTHVVGTHIVPGIDNGALRAEIERMLNPDLIPTDDRPEPPPITEIPDGPGMGHNSRPAGVAGPLNTRNRCGVCNRVLDFPDDPDSKDCGGDCLSCVREAESHATARAADIAAEQDAPPPAAAAQPPAAPEMDNRAPEPDPSPEPSVGDVGAPDLGPPSGTVQTVDMPGEPDWSKDTPGDVGSYAAYARFHIDRAAGARAAREWLNIEEQWQLRHKLGFPIGHRKQLERYCDDKHGAGT